MSFAAHIMNQGLIDSYILRYFAKTSFSKYVMFLYASEIVVRNTLEQCCTKNSHAELCHSKKSRSTIFNSYKTLLVQ